jgi:hypothetical protein
MDRPPPPLPNVPEPTTPMPAVTPGSKHGNGGTPGRRNLGAVYTICLTVLILVSLLLLGLKDLPKSADVLALIIGAGSAGILLGHTIRIEVNGREIGGHGQTLKRVTSKELPHEGDQRGKE